jgi:DNA-binding NarL/FixJ family response regulator
MIRILICDDQALVRAGLRMLLEAQDDLEVVGEAADGAEGVEDTRVLRPDVVLMDVRMPNLDGIAAARRILTDPSNRSRILMLTTFDEDEYVHEALRDGASGFLLKSAPPAELVRAVRLVHDGQPLLAPEITQRLVEDYVRRPLPGARPEPLAGLTERELEVLRLIALGHTNNEIAAQLFLSVRTVETHRAHIQQKLGVSTRAELVRYALDNDLIER